MPRTPRSLESLRRIATAIGREQKIRHWQALNLAAEQAGYSNWQHARNVLEGDGDGDGDVPPLADFPERPPSMTDLGREAYFARCREAFGQTVDRLASGSPQRVLTDRADIIEAIRRILAHTRSHTLLPTGGGQTFSEIRPSHERGAFELQVERGAVYVARPARLILQQIPQAPGDSFALLELATLAPSGANEIRTEGPLSRREEAVELTRGNYRDRSVWDQGFLDYDDRGYEIPLPRDARLVVRWFDGKMLFVSIGSLWNGVSATYDGRHDRMSVEEIRSMIEGWLPRA